MNSSESEDGRSVVIQDKAKQMRDRRDSDFEFRSFGEITLNKLSSKKLDIVEEESNNTSCVRFKETEQTMKQMENNTNTQDLLKTTLILQHQKN